MSEKEGKNPQKAGSESREDRLKSALRANLRRRKAASRRQTAKKDEGGDT
ncbi:hypothetical protein [Ponticaulis profundi]|uniref:DUF4169 domain-containing protein n=1 Tax=Ponticaulis profundi TaxID=2665222 RepID=A0ABW1SFW1_9PROT